MRRAYASKTVANLYGQLRDANPCAHAPAKGDEAEEEEVFVELEEYAFLRAHLKADAVDLVDPLVDRDWLTVRTLGPAWGGAEGPLLGLTFIYALRVPLLDAL